MPALPNDPVPSLSDPPLPRGRGGASLALANFSSSSMSLLGAFTTPTPGFSVGNPPPNPFGAAAAPRTVLPLR